MILIDLSHNLSKKQNDINRTFIIEMIIIVLLHKIYKNNKMILIVLSHKIYLKKQNNINRTIT